MAHLKKKESYIFAWVALMYLLCFSFSSTRTSTFPEHHREMLNGSFEEKGKSYFCMGSTDVFPLFSFFLPPGRARFHNIIEMLNGSFEEKGKSYFCMDSTDVSPLFSFFFY